MRTKKQFTMVWYDEVSKSIETYTGTRDGIEDRLKGDDRPSTLILIEGVEVDFAVEKRTVVTFASDRPRTRKPRVASTEAQTDKPKRHRRTKAQIAADNAANGHANGEKKTEAQQ